MPTEAQDWPPEPWGLDDTCPTEFVGADGNWISIDAATARRILLAVNTLAGIPSEDLAGTRANLARALVNVLTDEERLGIFGLYCRKCGCDNPSCYCEWDE